ncbi:helix-turn-helix transcriptional regulator [Streptomyces somaliensis]|uniref:Helix-turn-helix domain-containing protein n=1 Tax=Streptomyces somaliensis (strain ATCC 33201 / DSM 40738 / JCM 12659 / KCTC 9044 / NCTC 11332 / NRRL B-12077 / IP 733) TaxID=1134445 RepID=A0AA44ICP0_STRE0|nr:helix-turn-helix transcriptional regulator [Streptomyces somaliensis]NKY13388.1 helix-turn-helix domain-containing protein [Streptomyces somaliensis DSM 40738]
MQATAPPEVSGLLRRAKLQHFLRTCRGRLSPEEVGLVNGERRRTPGLRREEVAALAGVGVSWYTWLEQGRDINVSEGIVHAISNALRLDGCERRYFFRLAGLNPPRRTDGERRDGVFPHMRALVEGWSSSPAYLTDRYGRIELANESARSLFRLNASGDNCLEKFFTDADTRAKYPDTERVARGLVANFRAQSARFPDDPEFGRIAERLRRTSPKFAELWDRHEVDDPYQNVRKFAHPRTGVMVFDRVLMRMPEYSESVLTVYIAQPGAAAAIRARAFTGVHSGAA